MGITIVQKSNLKSRKRKCVRALILAGGAVSGGSFNAGGIKALNDYMGNFTVNDFDIYVGISSGSLLAAPLVGGITPEEIVRSLDGTSERFTELAPWHFYWPNYREFFTRPLGFLLGGLTKVPRILTSIIKGVPTHLFHIADLLGTLDISIPSLLTLIPSGVFDNSPIERYLKNNIKKNHLTNSFRVTEKVTGKRLYISAMEVDGARRVIFGPDENNTVTISEAVQASTAMPIFYRPARINGVDYVDGGVQETAHIDIAIKKGADLIICYNPFRPYDNKVFLEYIRKENKYVSKDKRLTDDGVMAVINQIFRALFHSRLHVALDQYRKDPKFKGDIILIEPKADDAAFFGMNPLILGNRLKAASLGYRSVRNSIEDQYDKIAKVLGSYGIKLTRKKVEKEMGLLKKARDDDKFLRKVVEE